MSDKPRSSGKPCPHCHISGPVSRIPDQVRIRCLKNRKDACVACQKLSEIEQKIEETRHALDNLLKEKEAWASVLNEHHDPLAHRLPVEITSRIFKHLLSFEHPQYPSLQYFDEKPRIRKVFLPGHVSKHWRKIAQGTPHLWSIIAVTINKSNCLTSVGFVRQWLERSGGLPLFIRLFVKGNVDEVATSVSQKIIASLIEHAHRWQVLDLALPHFILPWMSNAMPKEDLNCLEHVKLDITSSRSNDPDGASILHLQATPRQLTQGDALPRQLSINREHLTHFFAAMQSLEMDECIELIQAASQLLFCNLSEVKGKASSDIVVTSPSLKILEIFGCPRDWWNSFTFPSLETLRIIYSNDDAWINLHALLGRSGCKLKELVLRDDESTPNMIKVLKLTPDLRKLTLSGGVIMEPFFSLMDAAAFSSTGLLRNLASLVCNGGDEDFDWRWLLVFLTTMTTRPEKSLRSLTFTYMEELSGESKPGTLNDKKTFKLLLDIMGDMELEVLDCDDADLIESLRGIHDV